MSGLVAIVVSGKVGLTTILTLVALVAATVTVFWRRPTEFSESYLAERQRRLDAEAEIAKLTKKVDDLQAVVTHLEKTRSLEPILHAIEAQQIGLNAMLALIQRVADQLAPA